MKINKKFRQELCHQAENLLNVCYKPQGKSVDVFCIQLYEPDDPQAEVTIYNYEFTINFIQEYNHTVESFKYQGWCYEDIICNLGTAVAICHLNKHPDASIFFGMIKEIE